MTAIESRLLGTWDLSSYVEEDSKGTAVHPLGQSPLGRIMYDPDGNMSALLAHESSDTAADRRLYIAYAGAFHVDEADHTVRHDVAVSLDPRWMGVSQLRRIDFPHRNVLVLSTVGLVESPNGLAHGIITWRRMANRQAQV